MNDRIIAHDLADARVRLRRALLELDRVEIASSPREMLAHTIEAHQSVLDAAHTLHLLGTALRETPP